MSDQSNAGENKLREQCAILASDLLSASEANDQLRVENATLKANLAHADEKIVELQKFIKENTQPL